MSFVPGQGKRVTGGCPWRRIPRLAHRRNRNASVPCTTAVPHRARESRLRVPTSWLLPREGDFPGCPVSIRMCSAGREDGRLPFVGHHLLLPWPLQTHVLHVKSALSSTDQPRTFPAAVSLATRTQPESSPSHSGTRRSPEGVSAHSLLLKSERPTTPGNSLLHKCRPSRRSCVSAEHSPSGTPKWECCHSTDLTLLR